MLLAIVDRCVATSKHAWSQLNFARRVSIALLIIRLATAIHSIIFYSIYNNTCQVPRIYHIFCCIFNLYYFTFASYIDVYLCPDS